MNIKQNRKIDLFYVIRRITEGKKRFLAELSYPESIYRKGLLSAKLYTDPRQAEKDFETIRRWEGRTRATTYEILQVERISDYNIIETTRKAEISGRKGV